MQIINLDIYNQKPLPVLYTKQGDVGRKFKIEFSDGTDGYKIPVGAVFSVWYSGSSGEGNYSTINGESAFSVSGNSVTIEMISAMLSNSGSGKMCLIMVGSDGSQIGTWNIPYVVEEVPGMGSNSVDQYRNLLAEVLDAAARAERAAATLEIDPTLTVSGQAADAAAVGAALSKKVSLGNDIVVQNPSTATAWQQIDEVFRNMEYGSVVFCRLSNASKYDSDGLFAGGNWVEIAKLGTSGGHYYGYARVVSYVPDLLGMPTEITRIHYGAEGWQPIVNRSSAIIAKISEMIAAATGVAE